MLLGTFSTTVDAKGRVAIPVHFRRQLGARFVITHGPEATIYAFTLGAWKALVRKNGARAEFREFFLAGAAVVMPNADGRVHLPRALREWAGIRPAEEVVTAGIGYAAVLCRRERWDTRLRQVEKLLLGDLAEYRLPPLYTDRFLPAGTSNGREIRP